MKISEIANIEANLKQKIATYKNSEINQIVNSVIDFAVNMGKYFISSDFYLKKQILIPNSLLDSKKLVLLITKPLNAMLKNKNRKKWCAIEESNL